jgi:2,5-diamino-6-(ribosylamino)-4(3H)-pyrimidinone 5'-phosphate reductase
METEIIIHNSVSLDGSLTGFMPDMGVHYSIAGSYKHDARLIGSETVISGIEMFGEKVPDEGPEDFVSPKREDSVPWWLIIDSGGRLSGLLHTCRRFEFCRDVILLISEATPPEYIRHLKERNYNYIISGKEKVDIKMALEELKKKFGIAKILTDTGRVLGNLLINLGLVSEISLLVHPLIIGEKSYPIFSDIKEMPDLKLKESQQLDNGIVWLIYDVENKIIRK